MQTRENEIHAASSYIIEGLEHDIQRARSAAAVWRLVAVVMSIAVGVTMAILSK